mgnify:CR=1 FL=1
MKEIFFMSIKIRELDPVTIKLNPRAYAHRNLNKYFFFRFEKHLNHSTRSIQGNVVIVEIEKIF